MLNDKVSSDYRRDDEGYLVEPEDWSREFSRLVADEERIELNPLVWRSIGFIRQYYQLHGVAPDVRHITKQIADDDHISQKKAKALLFDQFPYGYVKQACKIAGMKRPRAWSTG